MQPRGQGLPEWTFSENIVEVLPSPTVPELIEPHPPIPLVTPVEPEPLPVSEAASRSQRRKRRSKGKQPSAELLEIIK